MVEKDLYLNVRSQKAYDSLMKQLEDEQIQWISDRMPTELDFWYKAGRNTVIIVSFEMSRIWYGELEDYTNEAVEINIFKPTDSLEVYFPETV